MSSLQSNNTIYDEFFSSDEFQNTYHTVFKDIRNKSIIPSFIKIMNKNNETEDKNNV